jgi:hypothetical protein
MNENVGCEETLEIVPSIEQVSRQEVIARLRARLEKLAENDHCLCETAGRLGIFCKGFRGLTDAELRERVGGIARTRRGQPRQALEAIAFLKHQMRQEASGARVCCDVEATEHAFCAGWNRFDAGTLQRYHLALIGSPVRISRREPPAPF